MSVSIRNRNPDVFFNATICGCKFKYDGDEYNSVMECFNARKISDKLWNPFSVPDIHMMNLTSVIGFLCEKEFNTAYVMDMCTDHRNYNRFYTQFKTIVCAYLFREYYRSVMSKIDQDTLKKLVEEFGDTYSYCCKLVSSITFNKQEVNLTDYTLDTSLDEYCIVCNNIPNDIPNIKLNGTVYMKQSTFQSLSKRGYSWINKLTSNGDIKVVCNSEEECNDYYWELVSSSGYNPNRVVDNINYRNYYTILLGSDCVDSVKDIIDWNKVYIMR